MAYIYQITNHANGKIYIGKTERTIQERWYEHCRDCIKDRYYDRPLYRAMRKYGLSSFTIEVIEETNNPEERETFWIEQKGSFKYGYNATHGGDGKRYIDYDLVVATYNRLGSQNDTAKELGICDDSVRAILRARGIETKTHAEVAKEKFSKMVSMYSLNDEYIKTFTSLAEAAQYMIDNNLTGCKSSTIRTHISEVCHGKRKTAAKFKWKFE